MTSKNQFESMQIVYLDEFMARVHIMCTNHSKTLLFVGCIGNQYIFVIDLVTHSLVSKRNKKN